MAYAAAFKLKLDTDLLMAKPRRSRAWVYAMLETRLASEKKEAARAKRKR